MSKNEIELGNRAHAIHEEMLALKQSATVNFYRMGELMKEVRDGKLWEAMGYETMRAYLACPELDLDESSVYRAIKVVEKFSDVKKLERVPVFKVLAILPHVTKENEDHLLEIATSLSRSDLIHQLHETVDEDTKEIIPPESAPGLPKIYRCNVCKHVKGIRWDDLCHCGWTPKQIEIISKAIDSVDLGEKDEPEVEDYDDPEVSEV